MGGWMAGIKSNSTRVANNEWHKGTRRGWSNLLWNWNWNPTTGCQRKSPSSKLIDILICGLNGWDGHQCRGTGTRGWRFVCTILVSAKKPFKSNLWVFVLKSAHHHENNSTIYPTIHPSSHPVNQQGDQTTSQPHGRMRRRPRRGPVRNRFISYCCGYGFVLLCAVVVDQLTLSIIEIYF